LYEGSTGNGGEMRAVRGMYVCLRKGVFQGGLSGFFQNQGHRQDGLRELERLLPMRGVHRSLSDGSA